MGCGSSKADGPGRRPSALETMTMDQVGAVSLIQRWYRRKQAELELRRKCCWQVFTDIEYNSEQEQLGLNNFFADLGTLKDALQDRKQKSMKRKKSGQVVDEDAIKISSLYSTDAGSHAISPETEDKLFNRPNPPTNLTVAVSLFPAPLLCVPFLAIPCPYDVPCTELLKAAQSCMSCLVAAAAAASTCEYNASRLASRVLSASKAVAAACLVWWQQQRLRTQRQPPWHAQTICCFILLSTLSSFLKIA